MTTARIVCAACLFAILGCGDNIGAGLDAATPSIIVQNSAADGHQHTLTIPCADVAERRATPYTTTDGPGHEHSIELTGDQLRTLDVGGTVTLTFTDGHPHSFIIAGRC